MDLKNLALAKNKNRISLLKSKEFLAIIKLESAVLKGLRNYFEMNGFIEITVPHITKATGACENIDTMFELNYFGRRAYLSQTGQLFLEIMSPFLQKVWCVIRSFRAEQDVDERHLTEFTLVEMEFLGNLDQLINYVEGAIFSTIREVEKIKEELEIIGIDDQRLEILQPPYKRLSYSQAIEILQKDFNLEWGDDLKSVHEKRLAELFGPVFITHYPKAIKFFNMRENDENEAIVNSTDLILPDAGEAVGGAEREFRYEKLLERLKSSNMLKMLVAKGGSLQDFDWYLEFWKENQGRLHSGCGIGVNRIVQSIMGAQDIRLTTPFVMNKENLY